MVKKKKKKKILNNNAVYDVQEKKQTQANAQFRHIWNRRPRSNNSVYSMYVQLYQDDNYITEYKILEMLGKGTSSFIWRAWSTEHSADVCIKTVPTDCDGEFLNEKFILSILEGIVGVPKVLNYGTMDIGGTKFNALITDVVGVSLKKFKKSSLLSLMDIENIWVFLKRVFSDIHKRGVLIADFKPDHIIVSKDGIYVVDYGGSYQDGSDIPSNYLISMFASHSSLRFKRLKPDDDIESLVLSLMYLFDSSVVPWWNRELSDREDTESLRKSVSELRKRVSHMIKNQMRHNSTLACIAEKIRQISKPHIVRKQRGRYPSKNVLF